MKSEVIRVEGDHRDTVQKLGQECEEVKAKLYQCTKDLEAQKELVGTAIARTDESHKREMQKAILAQEGDILSQKKVHESITEERNMRAELESKLAATIEELAAKEALLENKNKSLAELKQNHEIEMRAMTQKVSD